MCTILITVSGGGGWRPSIENEFFLNTHDCNNLG